MKNLGTYITIGIFFIGIVAGWGTLKANVDNDGKDIEKLKSKVEVLTTATDKMDVKQEAIKDKIDDVNSKLDKMTDVLISLKKGR